MCFIEPIPYLSIATCSSSPLSSSWSQVHRAPSSESGEGDCAREVADPLSYRGRAREIHVWILRHKLLLCRISTEIGCEMPLISIEILGNLPGTWSHLKWSRGIWKFWTKISHLCREGILCLWAFPIPVDLLSLSTPTDPNLLDCSSQARGSMSEEWQVDALLLFFSQLTSPLLSSFKGSLSL